jgi:ribosomal protein L11 methyltransferase
VPSWSITVEVDRDDAEETAAGFFEAGASGIEERDAEVAPMPGTPRPSAGKALLVAWFPERAGAERAVRALSGARMAEVADQDWSEAWKEGLTAFSVGRVFVRPSWVPARPPPGAVEIVLDPGMAFGTGTHPTTALCLQALDEVVAERPGLSVFDVGTGSGLLAIAAWKLGAGRVVGSDNDPVAVRVAGENVLRNGAALELTGTGVSAVPGPFDLVVANILANTLVELAPALVRQVAPGGTLLLAGLLTGQEGQVLAPYLAGGLVRQELRQQGEWLLLKLGRPAGRAAVPGRGGGERIGPHTGSP